MGDSKASSADIGKSPLCRRSIHTVLVGSKDNSSTDYDVLVQNCVQQRTPVDVKPRKEFGGPIGAFLLIFGLPMVVIYLNLIITQGNPALNRVVDSVSWPNLRQLASDTEAWIIVFFWFAGHMIWSLLPVGKLVDGTRLKNGDKLKYRCNGFYALVKDMSCFFWLYWLGYDLAGLLERKWMQLVTVWILFSIGLSLLLFVKSCEATEMERSPQGNTGCTVYDFFMGRELNPRLGPVDLKFLCELRPGLIGWVILDLAILVSDYDRNGSINWSLLFVVAAQTLYVADALWFEASILTTMDIVHEGFGFMLTFGDLAWVPFIYTLQVRYISVQGHRMPYYCLIPIVLLNAMGYYIFRASNLEKDRFRSDEGHPAVRGMETIATGVRGKRLLCGGWWGWLRHPNYLGDILMAFSWCLACGFKHALPYFYAFYLTWLLISRELRDERMNLRKYGSSWTAYCRQVPHRIFPGIW